MDGKRKAGTFCGMLTTAVFVLLIFTGTAASVFAKEKKYSEREMRALAAMPDLAWKSYISGEFAGAYEEYVKDQFPLRDGLVTFKNYCDRALLKTELKGIMIGKEGYYIENHAALDYVTELALANARALAEFGVRQAGSLGAAHVTVMLVPTAQTVLESRLPFGAYVYDQQEYIRTVAEYAENMEKESGEVYPEPAEIFLNVTEALRAHQEEYIYYRTDHHWTGLGAFYAYEYWAEKKGIPACGMEEYEKTAVTQEFLGTIHSKLGIAMEPDVITLWDKADAAYDVTVNLKDTWNSFYDMSYLDTKDKYSVFFGGNPWLVEIRRKYESQEEGEEGSAGAMEESCLLIIKDSYANCFAPIAAGSFGHIYMIDLRYFNMDVDTFIRQYGVTDVLVLYNADSAAADVYLKRLGNR